MRQILLTITVLFLLTPSLTVFSSSENFFSQLFNNSSENRKIIVPLQEERKIERKAKDLNPKVLHLALEAYHHAEERGLVKNPYLTVIDYSLDSTVQRLWVIDMKNQTIPFNTYVAHGKNSGNLKATHFSNRNGSRATALGVYLTKSAYRGHHVGYALQLDGLEKGINNHSLSRGTVIHGARYVEDSFIKQNGRAGRSWGCPAIPVHLTKQLIDTIKNGSVLLAYYPEASWLAHSKYFA